MFCKYMNGEICLHMTLPYLMKCPYIAVLSLHWRLILKMSPISGCPLIMFLEYSFYYVFFILYI